ncbi:MAG: ribonuclease E inhibitor RraB, partial [Cytophagaceae bacterium]|uniref:ribonuclease E inhibitor RraB n=1 Tax=Rhizobium sp. CFBP 13726 TaxID=2775296 RepID=UPI0010ED9DF0
MLLFEENHHILSKLKSDGLALESPRPIDFCHVFPDQASAHAFAQRIADDGFSAKVDFVQRDFDPWDVIVTSIVVPGCTEITDLEMVLGDRAKLFGGRTDGWGFFGE